MLFVAVYLELVTAVYLELVTAVYLELVGVDGGIVLKWSVGAVYFEYHRAIKQYYWMQNMFPVILGLNALYFH